MMHRIRHTLFFTICFALVVLCIHYLYTRNYRIKDTAIQIVQSFQFGELERGKDKIKIDPHGHGTPEKKKVEDVLPEIQQTPKSVKEKVLPPSQLLTTKVSPPYKDEKKEDPTKSETSVKVETKREDKPKPTDKKLCNERGDKLGNNFFKARNDHQGQVGKFALHGRFIHHGAPNNRPIVSKQRIKMQICHTTAKFPIWHPDCSVWHLHT